MIPQRDLSLLSNRLAKKGGHRIPEAVLEEALDFTLREEISFEAIQGHLDEAFRRTEEASGVKIRFSRYDRNSHENSHTFYLAYEGPLPSAASKEVKVDINDPGADRLSHSHPACAQDLC